MYIVAHDWCAETIRYGKTDLIGFLVVGSGVPAGSERSFGFYTCNSSHTQNDVYSSLTNWTIRI